MVVNGEKQMTENMTDSEIRKKMILWKLEREEKLKNENISSAEWFIATLVQMNELKNQQKRQQVKWLKQEINGLIRHYPKSKAYYELCKRLIDQAFEDVIK